MKRLLTIILMIPIIGLGQNQNIDSSCYCDKTRIIAEVDISYPVGATLGYLEATEKYAEKNLHIEETFDSEEEQSNFAESNQIDANEPNKSLSVTPTIEGLPVPAKASGV